VPVMSERRASRNVAPSENDDQGDNL